MFKIIFLVFPNLAVSPTCSYNLTCL